MGPACFIANILKTPRPNCVEVGEFLQYCMLNAVITNVRNFTSVAELKQAIVNAWQELSQSFIDRSINEWRRRL